MLLALATAAWSGMAGAVRFMDETTGPPVATNVAGFPEVLGPEATEPEHAGNFVGPLPEYMPTVPGRPLPSVFRGGPCPAVEWIATAPAATAAALIQRIAAWRWLPCDARLQQRAHSSACDVLADVEVNNHAQLAANRAVVADTVANVADASSCGRGYETIGRRCPTKSHRCRRVPQHHPVG